MDNDANTGLWMRTSITARSRTFSSRACRSAPMRANYAKQHGTARGATKRGNGVYLLEDTQGIVRAARSSLPDRNSDDFQSASHVVIESRRLQRSLLASQNGRQLAGRYFFAFQALPHQPHAWQAARAMSLPVKQRYKLPLYRDRTRIFPGSAHASRQEYKTRFPHRLSPAAARSGSTAILSISGTCVRRPARPSSTFPIRDHPKTLARIELPQGWHSHKVRVANGIMIVNHEVEGKGGPPDYRGGLADLRREESGRAKDDRQVGDRRRRRAPLRFRRPLRLCLGDQERLHRQHRRHSRSQGSRRNREKCRTGGFPANGRTAAKNIRGPISSSRAAIIRCASATG